jgi:hypothetical protein
MSKKTKKRLPSLKHLEIPGSRAVVRIATPGLNGRILLAKLAELPSEKSLDSCRQ